MDTISNTTCTKCQRCGEWTNYADDPHHKARESRISELEAERDRLREALSWSFIRTLLSQGMSIQQDYDAGKYKDYEEVSARLDAAARERCAALQEGE